MRKNALTEEERFEILQRIRFDSVTAIAKSLGRDYSTVLRFLDREGIKIQKKWTPLTEKEKQYILSHYTTMGHKAIAKKLKRGPATILDFYHANGLKSGLTGRFEKGRESPYKGMTLQERGYSPQAIEAMRPTQFRKGQRPWNEKPVGSKRIQGGEGRTPCVLVKAHDGRRTEGGHTMNYVTEARLVYEQTHGPIPEGNVVVHLNGNPLDNRPENLKSVPIGHELTVNHHLGGFIEGDEEANAVLLDAAALVCEGEKLRKRCRTKAKKRKRE